MNLTSYSHTENGKATTPLGLIALGGELSSGWWQPRTVTASDSHKLVAADQAWSVMNIDARDRQQVLAPLLANFRLSASALRSFLDICYSGPEACLEAHVLGFPSAYTAATALGSAVHKVLHTGHQRFQQSRPLGDAELLELLIVIY